MKTAFLLLALPNLGFALPSKPPEAPLVHESKDARGRVLRRIVFNADGTIHRTAFAYGAGAAKVTLTEDLDAARNSVRRLQEKFDGQGRITEREETSLEDGRRVGRRTTFRYDAAGRATSQTRDVE